MKLLYFLVFIPLLAGCKEKPADSLFTLLSADQTRIQFINAIEETEKDNVLNY